MSTDNDLIKLYSQRILALAADIPLTDRLDAPQASVRKRAPLCGSTVTVDLDMEAGRITRFGQDVKACALGQASAALMAANILGRSRAEVEAGRDQLRAMLKEGAPPPLPRPRRARSASDRPLRPPQAPAQRPHRATSACSPEPSLADAVKRSGGGRVKDRAATALCAACP